MSFYPHQFHLSRDLGAIYNHDDVCTRIVLFEKYKPYVPYGIGTRRVRAIWTPELARDLELYTHVDAEAELTALLAAQITQEIDRSILNELIRNTIIDRDGQVRF